MAAESKRYKSKSRCKAFFSFSSSCCNISMSNQPESPSVVSCAPKSGTKSGPAVLA